MGKPLLYVASGYYMYEFKRYITDSKRSLTGSTIYVDIFTVYVIKGTPVFYGIDEKNFCRILKNRKSGQS